MNSSPKEYGKTGELQIPMLNKTLKMPELLVIKKLMFMYFLAELTGLSSTFQMY